ncbi:MutS protein msh4 [Lecanora helva]
MSGSSRASTSYTSATTTYPSRPDGESTTRPGTSMSRATSKRGRPKTATTSTAGGEQQIICAISESRGLSPIVGLSFVNISAAEGVLCQILDSQTYPKTLHKLFVFEPTEILFMTTAAQPESKLYSIVKANLRHIRSSVIDRKYWAETTGMDYIQQLALKQDIEALKVSVEGNYYAVCCFAAVVKYIEQNLLRSFSFHTLRIKYEPSEGVMMIDLSTMRSLELIQNLQNAKSKDCLYRLLSQTLTPMGSRLLKSNVLQPSTDRNVLEKRWEALHELTAKEDVFFAVRQALKAFIDVDRVLTAITVIPTKPSIHHCEQSINSVILLKQYVKSIPAVYEALAACTSPLLQSIARLCAPAMYDDVQLLIDETINEDTTYQSQPLDLRNQRTYAVKSGVNGLLDVARQTYKEANADAYQLVSELGEEYGLPLDLKYDTARQYYIRISVSDLENRALPDIFINQFRKKQTIECQTLDLLKWNQKITDSHHEVLQMSNQSVQELIDNIRGEIEPLFKISEAIAMLDVTASFAHLVTTQEYTRPEVARTLAVKSGRHPIKEKMNNNQFVPNDVYATGQSRFQIITGCNMSGKSTYIRSIALMAIMAQCGSFVPAVFASFPIFHQVFARISVDDCIEANVSTFAAEMREIAFILRNVDKRSLIIIDELGRGTSTRDGLCIAIAIAEALVESHALVWFVTHFRDLPKILAERNGVVNLHLSVEMSSADKIKMLYKIADGAMKEEHYGIAMAKVMNFPPEVIEIAEKVSKKLQANCERRKKQSKTILLARRRKLILGLREQLLQAREGNMQGRVLATWLKKLQDEFVNRMAALEEEVKAVEAKSDDEEEEETVGRSDESPMSTEMDDVVEDGAKSTTLKESYDGVISASEERGSEHRYEMAGALLSETDEGE